MARDRGTSVPLPSEFLLTCLTKKIKDRWSLRLPHWHPCLRLGVKARWKKALGKGGYSHPSLLGTYCSVLPSLLVLTAALQSRPGASFLMEGLWG